MFVSGAGCSRVRRGAGCAQLWMIWMYVIAYSAWLIWQYHRQAAKCSGNMPIRLCYHSFNAWHACRMTWHHMSPWMSSYSSDTRHVPSASALQWYHHCCPIYIHMQPSNRSDPTIWSLSCTLKQPAHRQSKSTSWDWYACAWDSEGRFRNGLGSIQKRLVKARLRATKSFSETPSWSAVASSGWRGACEVWTRFRPRRGLVEVLITSPLAHATHGALFGRG